VPKCQDVKEITNIWKYLFKSRYKWENEVSKSQPKLQGRRISSIVVTEDNTMSKWVHMYGSMLNKNLVLKDGFMCRTNHNTVHYPHLQESANGYLEPHKFTAQGNNFKPWELQFSAHCTLQRLRISMAAFYFTFSW